MNILHRMVLKQLPGPFLGWLVLLLFLLLMQFLIKFLPDLTGRDLPLSLILELIAYNLAYMIVLAVPMSSLLATLMVFGSLAESNTWVVIRNCGITLWSLTWPVLVAAVILTSGMIYFNTVILPESNFRAITMWQTIRNARPGFELEPGEFYQEIDEYSILVNHRDGNLLSDILIYDYTQGITNGATIRADRGELLPQGKFLDMILYDGEIHRLFRTSPRRIGERYEKLVFERFQLRLNLSELGFQSVAELNGRRSDRSTPLSQMIEIVDSLQQKLERQISEFELTAPAISPLDTISQKRSLNAYSTTVADEAHDGTTPEYIFSPKNQPSSTARRSVLDGLKSDQIRHAYQRARDLGQKAQSSVASNNRSVQNTKTAISRYQVEIHKKYSISVACFIFVLIGIPLGLSIRRGGLGIACLVAIGIFVFYWVTLVQGEKLADRQMLSPWIGMWCANILISMTGIWLCLRIAFDWQSRPKYWRKEDS